MEMPIPDDWDGESFCCWSVKWPNSIKWKAILYGLIEQPKQGRFWDIKTGNIKNTQASFLPAYDYNFELKEVIVSCGDSGLQELAAAVRLLAERQCCEGQTVGGSNGGVTGTVPGYQGEGEIPLVGPEPIGLDPGEFPSNYPSEVEYLIDKCRLANMIADGWISTIRALGALTLTNIAVLGTLIGLALASVIILPPAAIPIMVTALLAMGGFMGMFVSLADELQESRDDIVCELYRGESASILIETLAEILDIAIQAIGGTGLIARSLKIIGISLVNSETLNQLFNGSAALGYPDADCTACMPQHWSVCDNGQLTLNSQNQAQLFSKPGCASQDCQGIWVKFDNVANSFIPGAQQYLVSVSGNIPPQSGCTGSQEFPDRRFFYADINGNTLAASENQITTQPCNQIYIVASAPFEIIMTITEA